MVQEAGPDPESAGAGNPENLIQRTQKRRTNSEAAGSSRKPR